MAYISNFNTEIFDVASTTATPALPAHETGDLLMCFISQDTGTTDFTTASSGWAFIGTSPAAGGARHGVAYKVAASGAEPDPTFSGSNDDWVITTVIVKDADATTPIDVENSSTWNAPANGIIAVPSVTTTTDNCLVFASLGGDGGGTIAVRQDNAATQLDMTNGIGCAQFTCWFNQYTAGAISAFDLLHTLSTEGGGIKTIAIRNKSGGAVAGECKQKFTKISLLGTGFHLENGTMGGNLASIAATIAGVATSATAPTYAAAAITGNYTGQGITFNVSTGAETRQGGLFTLTSPVDITGRNISYLMQTAASNSNATTRVTNFGYGFLIADTTGNWIAYRVLPRVNALNSTSYIVTITPGQGEVLDSSGTLDFTQVNRFAWFVGRSSATTATIQIIVKNLTLLSGSTLVGGGASYPANAADVYNSVFNYNIMTGLVAIQGSGQLLTKGPLQIGDGTNPTYASFSAQSTELPKFQQSLVTPVRAQNFLAAPNSCGITIRASAVDTINLASSIFATTTEQPFTIHASSSASAAYDFTGCSIVGYTVTNNVAGIAFNNATFNGTRGITLNGGSMDACIVVDAIGTTAVTTNNPANITDCSFTSAGTGHAIEITATGTFTFEGNTFTGYGADGTTDAAIYNNSGGAVTLEVPTGGQVPTVRNGAGSTTTISTPAAGYTLELPNIIDGSRYQIYNVTADTELDNALVSGGAGISHTYTEGADFTVGDIGRYRVTYQSGTTAKQTLEGEFTFTGGTTTNSLPISQTDQTEYNTFALDGSTVTEFAWDSGNIQIDINDLDNTTTIPRLAAWYYYFVTTATGIDEAFNAITWLAINQVRINTDIVNMKLDNTKATPLLLTGGRLYRSDGSTIIAATSNSIQVDYEPVYTVTVSGGGGGSLTAADVWNYSTRTLTSGAAPSAEVVAEAVRTELATELGRIDVATSTRLADADYTAPDNASIAAILTDTGTTGVVLANNSITSSVVANNAFNNSSFTTGYFNAVGSEVESAVADIKAKTDSLNFTIAGQVDANIQYVNDVQVKGTGTDADPWNPA